MTFIEQSCSLTSRAKKNDETNCCNFEPCEQGILGGYSVDIRIRKFHRYHERKKEREYNGARGAPTRALLPKTQPREDQCLLTRYCEESSRARLLDELLMVRATVRRTTEYPIKSSTSAARRRRSRLSPLLGNVNESACFIVHSLHARGS